jgi:Fe-S oxidoreductase
MFEWITDRGRRPSTRSPLDTSLKDCRTAMPVDVSNELFEPTPGLSYNPHDPQYFNKSALEGELQRSFDLCHSCRMCFKFCQSFPTLFDAIDKNDGHARTLNENVTKQVVDECFGCKLCYTNCPYTPAENHEFALDFPALMLRSRAVRAKESGIPIRDRMLSDPDNVGRHGTLLPILSNAVNRNRLMRVLMETAAGIHRDKLLPEFASETFEQWFDAHTEGKRETAGTIPVVLFHTCYVNWNAPEIGRDAVAVLEHNDCRVACPKMNCCGMPALDAGDVDFAIDQARKNVQSLIPWVDAGFRVAAINPTCSLMLKQEYPVLLDPRLDPVLAEAARRVSAATRDLGELLFELRQAGQFKEDFQSTPEGTIAYHVPCHLKKQSIGFRSRDMLRRIPGVKLRLVDRCSGHDGTWSMKTEFFQLSMKNGAAAFEEMQAAEAGVWTSDCPLAALQFEQATGKRPLHSVQVLARAYRPDGFPNPIPQTPT